MQAGAILVLCPVAAIAAALSFQSLHQAATPVFGPLAVGFPLLVDMLILGSTLAYLGGASGQRPLPGWRWTAHAGVSGTVLLNALAATGPATIAWHITPALVWSVLVEMTARQVTGTAAVNARESEPIPLRIWFSSPREATATWLQMARTAEHSHQRARADLAVHAAARHALTAAMPQHRHRRARRLIHRQLRAGALDPTILLNHLLGQDQDAVVEHRTIVLIQAFLSNTPSARTTSTRPDPHHRNRERPGSASPDTAAGTTSQAPGAPTPPAAQTRPVRPTRPRRSSLTPQDRRQRLQVAVDTLRTRPTIDGPQLGRELAAHGWALSARTARRVLAEANREISTTVTDLEHD